MIDRSPDWIAFAGAIGLFCLGLTDGAAAAEAEVLFPPHCTVVLFAGLPGDVESEKSYRDQMESWLEVVAASESKPEKVYVFWDSPADLNSRTSLPLETAKATREEFLALGKALKDESNPLVVIAWGHGGMQGRTPVLHVRGPRLTPADLEAFAEAQLARAISRWVLCFRGSGSFAREIAGPGHCILASEKDAPFGNDPIGLPLLAQNLRSDPGAALKDLAKTWGRATAEWYEERGLARTEEPTLWIDEQPPRLLADSGKALAAGFATGDSKTSSPQSVVDPAPAPLPEGARPLPPVWDDIARVDPRDYPEANAVVLRKEVKVTIGGGPSLSSGHETFVQVITPEGKHHGDFDFSFSPPQEEFTLIDCEVLRPDGKLVRLDPDDVRESGKPSMGEYRSARRKFFSLPGVAPGAILHVRYRRERKRYPLPHVSMGIPLGGDVPVVQSVVEVSVAKGAAMHFKFVGVEAGDPELKQMAFGTTYAWLIENIPARLDEALSPPEDGPALLLSTFPDWAAFAGWYWRISRETGTMTPEMSAMVTALTEGARSNREKLVALYNYVTGLRYVAVPLGVNSVRPHAAGNVFRNQFGDCKDKANLLNTMLGSIGIKAHLVLVPRFRQAHEAVPGLAFNHAISQVELDEEILWVDTTDDVCRFGILPPGDPGRKVLVIDGESTSLTELPAPGVDDHVLTLRGWLDCSKPDSTVPGGIAVTTSGIADYGLRSGATRIGPDATTRSLLASRYRPGNGAFALSRQSFTAPADLDAAFEWNGEGRCIGLVTRTASMSRVRMPFWIPAAWDTALHDRKTPLYLHNGYPLKLDEEIELTLPAGAKNLVLPPVREGVRDPFHWRLEWSEETAGRVKARLTIELLRGELTMAETAVLQSELELLLEAIAGEVQFSLTP